MQISNSKSISMATLQRLPMYYRYLLNLQKEGQDMISSAKIAEDMRLNPIQVRKDLACISSIAGKPKSGFNIDILCKDLATFLGYDNTTEAIIIGVGQLGKTLLSYDGFKNYGLNIVAGFDTNEDLCNKKINGKLVMNIDKLENFLERTNIHIGIITVPGKNAQLVCDKLVAAGIKAIWNFSPTTIQVPTSVVIKNEDMAASLAILSNQLKELYREEKL